MRKIMIAGAFALLAGCGEKTALSDAVFSEHEGAVILGAGSGGEIEVALMCDPTGVSDWPPLTVYVILPETGESLDASEGVATIDGRKVPMRLSLNIDGREIRLSDFWVQQHEGLKRAIIAGGVEDAEELAKALEKAKAIEFAGDGRRFRIDVSGVDSRKSHADICRAAAASPAAGAHGEEAARVATRLSNDQIEAAVTGHWKKGNADFERNGLRYRVVEAVETPAELPADAQARGIKALPGIGLQGDGSPFRTVMVAYAVFDDPAAADVYFDAAAFNLGEQEVAEIKSFRIERSGYPIVHMNCVFVPDAGNSVNCHYKTPDKRIVALLLLAEGPPLDFSGNERAIDLVFANEAAVDRASLAASASWAYLYDAVYR